MTTVTRFAPSPTGYLHIGGARTALFNWLYAKHTGGKFLLRIEDTDRERSTPEATAAILDGLKWLGLDWDGEEIHQFSRASRHAEIAHQLVEKGAAYHCYCSPEELAAMREAGHGYDRRWRDRPASDAPAGIAPVVRIKAPLTGSLAIEDGVQGRVEVKAEQLDDFILLRSDGTPTYMLAVVVDDHDMGITQIIRGDDHLNNAFRQMCIYQAMGWDAPAFAHIPLIHGADGAKLSKRHGALGVEAYREMGYLPEALRNYLLRLGWAHGDEEIIPTDRAIEIFSLSGIGKSPSRFDVAKLEHLNGHYIREADDARLAALIQKIIEEKLGIIMTSSQESLLLVALPGLKQRVKNINELADNSLFYFYTRPVPLSDKAEAALDENARALLADLAHMLELEGDWSHDGLQESCKAYGEKHSIKLGQVMAPLRAAITGSHASPSMFEVMALLGRDEVLARIKDVL